MQQESIRLEWILKKFPAHISAYMLLDVLTKLVENCNGRKCGVTKSTDYNNARWRGHTKGSSMSRHQNVPDLPPGVEIIPVPPSVTPVPPSNPLPVMPPAPVAAPQQTVIHREASAIR